MYFTVFRCDGCAETYTAERDLPLCPAWDNLPKATYDSAGMKCRLYRDAVAAQINF